MAMFLLSIRLSLLPVLLLGHDGWRKSPMVIFFVNRDGTKLICTIHILIMTAAVCSVINVKGPSHFHKQVFAYARSVVSFKTKTRPRSYIYKKRITSIINQRRSSSQFHLLSLLVLIFHSSHQIWSGVNSHLNFSRLAFTFMSATQMFLC